VLQDPFNLVDFDGLINLDLSNKPYKGDPSPGGSGGGPGWMGPAAAATAVACMSKAVREGVNEAVDNITEGIGNLFE